MRIAVATEGGAVAGHFGHCPEYTLVDVRDGQPAHQLFADHGIETVVGVSGPVDEVVRAYLAGTVEQGESLCDHDSPGHVKRCDDDGCGE